MSEVRLSQSPTAEDVARLAGVSKSAVSRAFTPGASVSPGMRQRVEAAADRLGYRPNPIARSLTTRKSALIGVAMSHMDQFYAPMLTRLTERLSAEGLRLLLFKSQPGVIADAALEDILQYNVDALILVSVQASGAFAERCQRAAIPLVGINPTLDAHPLSTITAQNEAGGAALADYLIRGGHRRFAFMAGAAGSYTSNARRSGFARHLATVGQQFIAEDCGGYTFEDGLDAARRLLARADRPDAIFCANDSMACAAIDVARREFGLSVGAEVSIVGFDDEQLSAWPMFDLTTFSLPIGPLVDQVIDLLRAMWDAPGHFAALEVPGTLIERSSARRPPPPRA